MNLSEHAQRAIENATQHKSKISNISVYNDIKGMTSEKVQHLLNNLIDQSFVNYLEIGVYNGKSFFAAIDSSNFNSAVAIDNFSQIFHPHGNDPSNEFQKLFPTYTANKNNVKFLNKDCWAVQPSEIPNKINVYFYDGNHSHECQYNSLKYYYEFLENEFIFVVDDWSDPNAKSGTNAAIKDLNLEILFEKELLGTDWWADIKVLVLRKK